MPKYLVKAGLDYPPNRRAEAGDIVDDIPSKSIKWLRDQGLIEPADASAKAEVVSDVEIDEPVAVKPAPVSKVVYATVSEDE